MQSQLDRLIILLSTGVSLRKLYFANHPRVLGHLAEIRRRLGEVLDATGREELFVGVVEGKFVYEGRHLVGPSIVGGQLIALAGLLRCGGFRLLRGATEDEFTSFLGLMVELKAPVANLAEARALLTSKGILGIQLAGEFRTSPNLANEEDQAAWQGKDQGTRSLDSPVLVYQALYDTVTAAHGNAALDRNVDIPAARSVSEYLLHSVRESFTDIMHLVHYPDHDSYTVGHSVRVAALAVFAGDRHGLADEHLLALGTAALLHDVGKGKIPDEILFKQGKLDPEEYRIMQSHAPLGAEILMEHKTATPLDVAAAWGHHLRHDGGGYPARPYWGVRDRVTALLQVCDVFEALTAARPYKAPLRPRAAYEIMLKDEGAFEPGLLQSFIKCLGLYPPGNVVRLSDGSLAEVVKAGEAIDRPILRRTRDAAGAEIPATDQPIVNLEAPEHAGLRVTELLLEEELVLP